MRLLNLRLLNYVYKSRDPLLLPARKDAPLRILTRDQADDMDLQGFTVVEETISAAEIGQLRDEFDRLEHETVRRLEARGRPQQPRAIAGADRVTFTSGLAQGSALARSFCAGPFFQKVCHDVLNCDDVRLYREQAVYTKPSPGRVFPRHQVPDVLGRARRCHRGKRLPVVRARALPARAAAPPV